MVKLSINSKSDETFRIFDKILNTYSHVVLAYSGGKDSTAVAILLYEWLKRKRFRNLDVTIIHNDTLGEIPEMEFWARSFMESYVRKLKKVGINVKFELLTPKASETFYWRTFIRGYPAPNFKFRWCVWLLKRNPTTRYLKAQRKETALFVGTRDDESSFRSLSLRKRSYSCPLARRGCTAHYLLESEDVGIKIAPIRDWSTDDVWYYLSQYRKNFKLEQLFKLYGILDLFNIRYGCWYCTLIKKQLPHYLLRESYLFFEAARILYKLVSDIKELRIPKDTGYSRLGALNLTGRGLVFHITKLAEEKSGIRLYGLDEAKLNGYTLRQIFYGIDEREAQKVIEKVEENSRRRVKLISNISELRSLSSSDSQMKAALKKLSTTVKDWKDATIKEYLEELINDLESELY